MAERRLAPLLAAVALAALTAATARGQERLLIEYADQAQRLAQGDSVSYYLDGNVRARRGDLRLTAQHVVVLEWLGLLDASRDVHMWDAETELYADHLVYTDSVDQAVATGNVQVIDRRSGSQLRAQQVVYDRLTGLMTATQQPEMILLPQAAEGTPPDSAPAPVHVWGEQVRLLRATEEVVVTRNVLIRRGEELTAKADSARFAQAVGLLELRLQPRVETDRFYVEGTEIDVRLPEDRLESLVARGAARASSVADSIPDAALEAFGRPSPNSWIAGDTVRFAFAEGVLRTLLAIGRARSLNYALEGRQGDAATWALSYVLAGRIALIFEEGGGGVARVEASEDGRGLYRTVAVAGAEPVMPVRQSPADTTGAAAAEAAATDTTRAPAAEAAATDTAGAAAEEPAPPDTTRVPAAATSP